MGVAFDNEIDPKLARKPVGGGTQTGLCEADPDATLSVAQGHTYPSVGARQRRALFIGLCGGKGVGRDHLIPARAACVPRERKITVNKLWMTYRAISSLTRSFSFFNCAISI